MKETIRSASVTEIYNSSIQELNDEKKMLKNDINKIMAGRTGYIILRIIGIILTIVGLFALRNSFGDGFPTDKESTVMFLYHIFLSFAGIFLISKSGFPKSNLESLKTRIIEIDNEIKLKRIRKQSLLDAEEVIVSKDIKNIKSSLDKDNLTVAYEDIKPQKSEKTCPMCAETIKYAAIICRYCGHKFVENKENT